MVRIRITFIFITLFAAFQAKGQFRDTFEASKVVVPYFHYTYAIPMQDFGKRYGVTNAVGAGLFYKTKSNWQFGGEYNTYFGSNIKENVLGNLYGSGDGIINTEGVYENVKLYQRGFYAMGLIGKVFPISPNRNSGIVFKLGAGAMQHKIKMKYNELYLPALAGDNYKGYDRLTNGFTMYQFLGYQLLDPRRRLDFYIGVDLLEGFTNGVRTWNWDLMESGKDKRLDLQLGFKFGIMLAIYKKDKSEEMLFDN